MGPRIRARRHGEVPCRYTGFAPAKLEALKQSARSDDWKTAADVYLEIALEAKGTPESAHVEALGPLLSLRDGERMAAAVGALAGLS